MSHPTRRHTLQAMALAWGTAMLPGCASSRPPSPSVRPGDTDTALAQLREWLDNRVRKQSHINLSLALLDGETIRYATGLGIANPGTHLQASEHVRYRAGSVSKVFTAMAAMQLAEQGRLDLDAPLADVLTGFHMRSRQAGAATVTPRLILRHRSGLPTDWTQGMWHDQPAPFSELTHLLHNRYLSLPPDQMYAYSNVGFTLLGAAIEHITGEPFASWMHAHLLAPMGMQHSAFEVAPPSGPMAAMALNAKGQPEQEPGLRDLPAGGLNTCASDLLQLARMWFNQGRVNGTTVLTPASLMAMQTPPQPPSLADGATMGLGWHLLDEELDGVGPLLWHAGGTPHHHAQLMLLPQLKVAVAVMSSSVDAGELAQEVALKALSLMAMARTGTDATRTLKKGVDPTSPPADPLTYAGLYDTPMGLARIEVEGKNVSAVLAGQRAALVRQPDGYLRLSVRLLGLIPVNLGTLGEVVFNLHPTADGQVWLLARRKGRFMLAGTRLSPVPISPAWTARLGTYHYVGTDPFLAEQIQSVRLIEDAGLLLAEVSAGSDSTAVALAPLNDHEAMVRGLGRGRGDTVLAQQEVAGTTLLYEGMPFARHKPS